MLRRLIQHLFPRRLGRRTPPGAARAAAILAAASAAPRVAPVGPDVIRPEDEGAGYDPERPLREFLMARIEEMVFRFSVDGKRGDLPGILRALEHDAEMAIRQPPLAFQQALAESQRDDVSVAELVRLIERNPVLIQALLKHANSAFYAVNGECTSIHDAVRRIGGAGVHTVVLGCMVEGLLCRPGRTYAPMVNAVWSHSVRTAPIARDLAAAFGVAPEQAYAVAMLHDVGKLVLFDRLVSLRAELRRELQVPEASLSIALQRLHEPLGALAATRWGLGDTIARAIATHHRVPVPAQHDALSEVVYVAERADLAHVRGVPLDLSWLWAYGRLTGHYERAEQVLAALDEQRARELAEAP